VNRSRADTRLTPGTEALRRDRFERLGEADVEELLLARFRAFRPMRVGFGNPYFKKPASRIFLGAGLREAAAMNKELAYRETDGIAVTPWWHSGNNRLSVSVHDGKTGDWFALNAEAHNALDVFEHPFPTSRDFERTDAAVQAFVMPRLATDVDARKD